MVSAPSVDENLATAGRLIAEAAARGARLILLPEYWPTMGMHERDKLALAEDAASAGPIQSFMSAVAREHGVWLIGGTLPMIAAQPDKVWNTTLVYGPDGVRVTRYDKIHLFSFNKGAESYDEARTIAPGAQVATFEAPFGRVGLSICYDLRFPELYRAMGECALMAVPAAFTCTTGKAHWEVLLRARAIENQCYVLAAAQGGHHKNGRDTWGHSMLIDPWGEIKAELEEGEGIVVGDIEASHLRSVRQNLPALQHRKL
jgi:nitrilase